MSDAIHRFEFMMQLACGVLRENCSDVVRFYDDAKCDANCIADDLESAATDAIDALLKVERERALREAVENLSVYAPSLVDGPEHDVGYYYGYATAFHHLLDLISEDATDG